MRVQIEETAQELVLDGELVGKGGEAVIYPVPDQPALVAKIYHKPIAERADKLAAMIAAPPTDPMAQTGHVSIAWPTARLFAIDGERHCVGYLMPRVREARLLYEFFNPKARQEMCKGFHHGYLLRTARNLASAVRAVHERGYVIGDVNESNILATGRALVTLVDTDSFQVAAPEQMFRCGVGKPEYTPPELQGARFSEVDRGQEHDRFGLAVLIFQLLMQGTHPFQGIFTGQGEPGTIPQRIRAGFWPYTQAPEVPFRPSPHAPPFTVLPAQVRELMERCFEKGQADPAGRPDASSWQKALGLAEEELQPCARNDQHRYHRGLGDACPWCEMAQRQGRDPFPSLEQAARTKVRQSPSEAESPAKGAKAKQTVTRVLPPPLPPALPKQDGMDAKPQPSLTATVARLFRTSTWPWVAAGAGGLGFVLLVVSLAVAITRKRPDGKAVQMASKATGFAPLLPGQVPPHLVGGPQEEMTCTGRIFRRLVLANESHFFIATPSRTIMEAFTDEKDFMEQVVDYLPWDTVSITGSIVEPKAAAARMQNGVPLLKLRQMECVGAPGSRAIVGQKRDPNTIRRDRVPGGVAGMPGNQPPFGPQQPAQPGPARPQSAPPGNLPAIGTELRLSGRYFGYTGSSQTVQVQSQEKGFSQVMFPVSNTETFADYKFNDAVEVTATVAEQGKLLGKRIVRVANPRSEVTDKGRAIPPLNFKEASEQWRQIRRQPQAHANEKVQAAGVFEEKDLTRADACYQIKITNLFFSYDRLNLYCSPEPAVAQFLAELKKGDEVLFEFSVMGTRSYNACGGLWSMSRIGEPERKVAFTPAIPKELIAVGRPNAVIAQPPMPRVAKPIKPAPAPKPGPQPVVPTDRANKDDEGKAGAELRGIKAVLSKDVEQARKDGHQREANQKLAMAKKNLEELIGKYPNTNAANQARQLLDELNQ